ncbi:MAG: flavin reductase [Thiobacillus sp.]|nr:flavin reductase [Thiobacillus sp.]
MSRPLDVHNPVKRLFMSLTQGVYIVGVAEAGLHNAFTASSVMQVSMQPPMVALAVNPGNASYALLMAGGIFAVTVLPGSQRALADLFGNHSARDTDKLDAVSWHAAPSGAPVIEAGVSYLDCRIVSKQPAGDHVVVFAEVTGGEFLHPDESPLQYSELGDLDGSDELMPDHLGGKVPPSPRVI